MNASFDFTKYLSFIEAKGKELFNPNFKVLAEDYEIIFQLLVYFLHDATGAEKYNISFRKGILLSGPVGCGKTSLMSLLKFLLPKLWKAFHKLGRKNYLFCGNHDAAENAAIIYSLLGCCKACDVNPREWLIDVLTRIPTYNNDYSLDLADLLPHNWKTSKNLQKTTTEV